jgi:hypothetical protein
MRKEVAVAVALLVLLGGCKRKLKLEGKVTGFKPGTETLMIHVVSEKGATVTCEPPGYACKTIDVGASGETDAELETSGQTTDKKVYLRGRIGPAENQIVVDPAASMPPTVKVSVNRYIECVARECSGSIDVAPAGHLTLKAPAGTLVNIGSDKLTVGANGNIDAPVNLTPALKDEPLSKVFAKDVVTFGSSTLTLTFPDKTTTSAKFDLTTEGAPAILAAIFKNVATGPALFPWEKGAGAKGKPVALYSWGRGYVGGAADATLAELHVIVLADDQQQRKAPCSYINKNTGQKASANLTMHDLLATAHERTTGKKLGTKVFTASSLCDWEVTGKSGASLSDQDSYPDPVVVAHWGASLAR